MSAWLSGGLLACEICRIQRPVAPPTKEEVNAFAGVRLSACLSVCSKITKNVCMDLDEMLRVDRRRDMDELINF